MDVHTKDTTRILGVLPPPPRPEHVKPQLPTHVGRQKPFTIQTTMGDAIVIEHYKYSELLDMMYICKDPEYKGSPYTKNYRMILYEVGLSGSTPEDIKGLMKSDPYQTLYHVKFPNHKMEWISDDDDRILRPPVILHIIQGVPPLGGIAAKFDMSVNPYKTTIADIKRYIRENKQDMKNFAIRIIYKGEEITDNSKTIRGANIDEKKPIYFVYKPFEGLGGKTKRKKSKSKSKKYK